MVAICTFLPQGWADEVPDRVVFPIKEFLLEGNTIFNEDNLRPVLMPHLGEAKTAEDVEKARADVEQYYQERGYPTALVNIPEQRVADGVVRLEVIESTIHRVRVKGNRYFTRETLLKEMPAFRPGEILYLPDVKRQLGRVNRNPDLKVAPVLMPGKALGTIDVELRVKDKLPLHGFLEVNNRSTHTTTDTRLNAMLRYDNLWQKEHSISAQFQTSPEDTDEVQLMTGSYAMPSPWNDQHMIALYGLVSDSDSATAEGIQVLGQGFMVGLRYLANLESLDHYLHNLVIGLDYKDFEDDIEGEENRVRYLPLYLGYTGIIPDKGGQTTADLTLNAAFRNLSNQDSDIEDFEYKRSGSRGNYIFATLALERQQKLGRGWHLLARIGGQLSSQPLISNEQYVAGGVATVRGYKESEAAGDNAVFGRLELSAPDVGAALDIGSYLEMTPYAFYDAAALKLKDPLPGEERSIELQGAGAGLRGYLAKYIEYRLDWATALEATDTTQKGDHLLHFKVALKF